MKHPFRRALPLAVCALLVLAIAAATARADLTPVGASLTGTANTPPLTITEITIGTSVFVYCPRTTITARITAARQISGALDAVQSCSARAFGSTVAATVSFSGLFTIPVTSSVLGTNMSGGFKMDTGSVLTVDFPGLACRYSVWTPQGPVMNAVTFQQATQVLTLAVRPLITRGSGGVCGTGTPALTITGTFAVSPRVTITL